MTKHTPGPWETDGTGMTIFTTVPCNSAGFKPLIAAATAPDLSLAECRANASLIAAAPDLLEALEAMVKTFGNSTVLSTYGLEQVATARAAIAKARGEA